MINWKAYLKAIALFVFSYVVVWVLRKIGIYKIESLVEYVLNSLSLVVFILAVEHFDKKKD